MSLIRYRIINNLNQIIIYKRLFYNIFPRNFSTNHKNNCTKDVLNCTKDVLSSNKSIKPIQITKDQRLILTNKEEVELFTKNEVLPNRPIDVENSIIVRLIKLSDPVTSPLGSSILCSQYGLRKDESRKFIIICLTSISILISLGIWQLNRSKWKAEVISFRKLNLSLPIIYVNGLTNLSDSLYRIVEASGVLDVKNEYYVGPRSSLNGDGNTGFLVVCPLRFNDGSCILVNRGWISRDYIEGKRKDDEIPEWVTLRGVITGGELVDDPIGMAKNSIFKIKNSPYRRNSKIFMYLDPNDIGDQVISKYPDDTKHVVLNAYDIIYHDDQIIDPIDAKLKLLQHNNNKNTMNKSNNNQTIPKFYKPTLNLSKQDYNTVDNDEKLIIQNVNNKKRTRYTQFFQMKSKTDYLTFYADEHTHVNYAIQWFLMAASITTMMLYKLINIKKLRKFIQTRITHRHTDDNSNTS